MTLTTGKLQQVLHDEIPLTRDMLIDVEECSPQRVILTAPLGPNINHKCTAFGGSLYSIAVLSGWSLLYTNMAKHSFSGHIVIQHSEVDYRHPVDSTLRAICSLDDEATMQRFLKTYQRRKRARIQLNAVVEHQQQPAFNFTGQYVVHD